MPHPAFTVLVDEAVKRHNSRPNKVDTLIARKRVVSALSLFDTLRRRVSSRLTVWQYRLGCVRRLHKAMVRGSTVSEHFVGDGLDSHLQTSTSGFLTKAQQEILDAAVKEKQKSGRDLGANSHSQDNSNVRIGKSQSLELKAKERLHDRHSRARSDKHLGKPKKSGAGGKYNWGASLDVESSSGAHDPNDPNYDSADEISRSVRLQTTQSVKASIYKDAVVSIVKEYFLSGDAQEAAQSLQELNEPEFGHHFVKRLITISLDGNDRTREMASSLLSSLYAVVLPPEEVEKGFLALAENVDDLTVDVPAAADTIAHFMARAVTDDILPPAFLARLSTVEGQGEAAVHRKAECLLKAPHSAERILRCWGSEALVTFSKIRESIEMLLQEFIASGDKAEAAECLHRIGLPLVHHELVKQVLCMALTNPKRAPMLLELLAHMTTTGNVSEDQLVKGFKRVAANITDLSLDVPNAAADFDAICATAHAQGWLPVKELRVEGGLSHPTAAAMTHSLQAFKAASAAAIKEYYSSGDTAEVARCLQELNEAGFHSLVVKLAVQLALDCKDREREMTAVLIQDLCPLVLSRDQVALGFTRLLACAEDLSLDSPDAPHQMALMLGRIIVDEVLPPAFLTAVLPSLKDQSLGVSIVQTTGKLLSARHAAERLQICWHCGNRSIADLKSSIKDLVGEYVVTGDPAEAARCWRDLDVSFYGHQLVFTILVNAFEAPAKADQLLQLIKRFAASGEVSQTQIQKGFERVELQLADLRLDYPSSLKQFESCKEAALQNGWLASPLQY